MNVRKITSRFSGACKVCGVRHNAGDVVYWDSSRKSKGVWCHACKPASNVRIGEPSPPESEDNDKMGARKARDIVRLSPRTDSGGRSGYYVKSPWSDDEVFVSTYEAPRPELMGACSLAFGPVRQWKLYSKDELADMLYRGTLLPERLSEGKPKPYRFQPVEPTPSETDSKSHGTDEATVRRIASELDLPIKNAGTLISNRVSEMGARVDALAKELNERMPKKVYVHFPERVWEAPKVHHPVLTDVVTSVSAGVHVMLVGPAGTGKSILAEQAADAIGKSFYTMSCEPTQTGSAVRGYRDANGNYHSTPARDAYNDGHGIGHLFCLDEMDNMHPSVGAGLNQMLANGRCAFADGVVDRGEGFVTVGTANTYGNGGDRQYVGRSALDKATLDRFLVIDVDYDPGIERGAAIAFASESVAEQAERWIAHVQAVRKRAVDLQLQVIVSMRASIDGVKLLTAGMPWEKVEQYRLFGGMDAVTVSKLRVS